MIKQTLLFSSSSEEADEKYSSKIESVVYEPRHAKPHIMQLYDTTKTKALIREIDASCLPEDEKAFLRAAAYRHAIFNYERIADYYAHSSAETQRFIERSALVIIDFDEAIDQGFVRICDNISKQFLEEYSNDDNSSSDEPAS